MWSCFEGLGWWMPFGWIWMAILWGGIIAFTIWGVKKLSEKNNPAINNSSLETAKERYAKGEISREEFKQIKKDLS
ncbi:SHOCT domain-containing protein [Chloroflexota bacterium]